MKIVQKNRVIKIEYYINNVVIAASTRTIDSVEDLAELFS